MAETSGQERTEEATPKRRQDARKKGTIAKSVDLSSAIVIFGVALILPGALANLGRTLMEGTRLGIAAPPSNLEIVTINSHLVNSFKPAFLAFLPIVGLAMALGLASSYAQVGFVLTAETMKPTAAKLNPLNGIKRMFSAQAAMEGAKAIAKTLLFGFLAYTTIQSNWEAIMQLSGLPPSSVVSECGRITLSIFTKIATAWLVLAAIDYFFQRKQVDKQLRMTKQEVRQEMKDAEKSPELQMAMAQRRRKLSRGRMAAAMKKANVVITNPTHFAVALHYEPNSMHAPQVVAKGADYLALKIRETAEKNKIPIVPNPPLARQLYKKCEVGDFVPRDLFQAVAEVLAYVYGAIKDARGRTAGK